MLTETKKEYLQRLAMLGVLYVYTKATGDFSGLQMLYERAVANDNTLLVEQLSNNRVTNGAIPIYALISNIAMVIYTKSETEYSLIPLFYELYSPHFYAIETAILEYSRWIEELDTILEKGEEDNRWSEVRTNFDKYQKKLYGATVGALSGIVVDQDTIALANYIYSIFLGYYYDEIADYLFDSKKVTDDIKFLEGLTLAPYDELSCRVWLDYLETNNGKNILETTQIQKWKQKQKDSLFAYLATVDQSLAIHGVNPISDEEILDALFFHGYDAYENTLFYSSNPKHHDGYATQGPLMYSEGWRRTQIVINIARLVTGSTAAVRIISPVFERRRDLYSPEIDYDQLLDLYLNSYIIQKARKHYAQTLKRFTRNDCARLDDIEPEEMLANLAAEVMAYSLIYINKELTKVFYENFSFEQLVSKQKSDRCALIIEDLKNELAEKDAEIALLKRKLYRREELEEKGAKE